MNHTHAVAPLKYSVRHLALSARFFLLCSPSLLLSFFIIIIISYASRACPHINGSLPKYVATIRKFARWQSRGCVSSGRVRTMRALMQRSCPLNAATTAPVKPLQLTQKVSWKRIAGWTIKMNQLSVCRPRADCCCRASVFW